MIFYNILLIIAEILLSSYPQLIKLVNTNLFSQLSIRFITFAILGLLFTFLFDCNISSGLGAILKTVFTYSFWQYISLGLISILHVVTSYSAFHLLSSGISSTLFYTYPLFNIIGRILLYGEHIPINKLLYFIFPVIGVYLISTNGHTTTTHVPENTNTPENTNIDYVVYGIFAGLLSAITETIVYLIIKNQKLSNSPFQNIILFYLLGAIITISIIIYNYITTSNTTSNTATTNTYKNTIIHNETNIQLTSNFFSNLEWLISGNDLNYALIFTIFIGFFGTVIRYFLIPRISTLTFNSLIFLGIIFAYIWGYYLSNEKIDIIHIIGSILIIITIFMVNRK